MASFLADDPLTQALFHLYQLLPFAFQHAAHRDAGPAGDHLGDIFVIHLFLEHLLVPLERFQILFGFFQLALQFVAPAIAQFGHPGQVALPLGPLLLDAQLLLGLLDRADILDQALFIFPVGFHAGDLGTHGSRVSSSLARRSCEAGSDSFFRASRSISAWRILR
jgi:hypothetical protein